MLRSLVGSEMCIRDRVNTRVCMRATTSKTFYKYKLGTYCPIFYHISIPVSTVLKTWSKYWLSLQPATSTRTYAYVTHSQSVVCINISQAIRELFRVASQSFDQQPIRVCPFHVTDVLLAAETFLNLPGPLLVGISLKTIWVESTMQYDTEGNKEGYFFPCSCSGTRIEQGFFLLFVHFQPKVQIKRFQAYCLDKLRSLLYRGDTS